jgi:hypothetical protein
VLEKMSESGFSGLDLVSRTRTDDEVMGDDVRIIERNRDDFKTVFQDFDFVVIRKDIGTLEHGSQGEEKNE